MIFGGERLSIKFPVYFWLEHLVRYKFAANFVRDNVVVDCACGSGIGSQIFLNSGAKKLEGFDLSEDALEMAKKSCQSFKNANFSKADATKMTLTEEFAEVFVSLETIEHIQADRKYLGEVKRILKNEGTFICSTPNRNFMNPDKNINSKPFNKFHVREYSSTEFYKLLKEFFQEVDLYGFNALSVDKLRIHNKIKRFFRINDYIWMNLVKNKKIIFDKIENYKIEKLRDGFEYEYLIAVCRK